MRINHAIRVLITSDFVINSGLSLFGPIFAIFVADRIVGGSIAVVGYAAAITQVFKVSLQIPIARWLDRNHGEFDDFYSMVAGSYTIAITPFLYLFAETATHIYLIQALVGIGAALAVPPWFAIFTRHIDRMRENVEWSLESVAIGISGASAAALGGFLADRIGFDAVFLLGGLLALVGATVQIKMFKDLKGHVSRNRVRAQPDRAT